VIEEDDCSLLFLIRAAWLLLASVGGQVEMLYLVIRSRYVSGNMQQILLAEL
jgi:hypothetical protein